MIRRVLILAIFLFLGALANVLPVIVLSCVVPPVDLMQPYSEVATCADGADTYYVMVHRHFGADTVHSSLYEPHTDGQDDRAAADPPGWIAPAMLESGGEVTARGWPMRAAWFESSMDPTLLRRPVRGGWVTPLPDWRSSLGVPVPRVIGYLPIWRGIIVNTLFYALVLWTIWMTWIAIRNARRRRKGLCPSCKYDLRGADHAVCPECGR